MNVTNKIEIHLDDKRHLPPIDVMQGDSNTRVLDFSLYSGAEAWNVPDGVSVAVAYVRRDGAKGIYDTLADGSSAVSVSGNTVSVVVVPQALAVAGETKLTVVFTADGEQLATFCVTLRVAANPAIGAVEPEDYINLRQVLIEMVEKAMEETGALPDFVVGVFGGEAGYFSDESFLDIQYAYNSGRTIRCTFDTGEQELVKLPLVKDHPGKFYFSAVCEGVEYLVTISEDEAGETAVTVTQRTVGEGSGGSGKDGGYYTPTVTQVNDSTAQISFAASKADMPAVAAQQITLPAGPQGKPGADYALTDADKSDIVRTVKEQVPLVKTAEQPTFVNSIEECTDTTKLYVLPDGYLYAYMYTEVTDGGCTNQIPISTDADGSVYNGKGWKENLRVNSSGAEKEMVGYNITGYIPCQKGDTIRGSAGIVDSDGGNNGIALFDANKQWLRTLNVSTLSSLNCITVGDDNSAIITLTSSTFSDDTAFFRLWGKGVGDDTVITVNEEITEGTTEKVYKWTNTGHAFVPADYEDRIVSAETAIETLNEARTEHETRISALENAPVDELPDYVVSEAEDVIDQVIAAQGNRTFTLAAITDMHYGNGSYTDGAKNACKAMKYIDKRIKLDAVAVLGDYTDGYPAIGLENAIGDFKAINSILDDLRFAPNLRTQGNHDYYANNFPITHRFIQAYSEDVVWGDKLGGYFYKDFDDFKLRVICVNTTETGNANIACSTEQYQWFADSLDLSGKANVAEWQILILSHHPLDWYTTDSRFIFGRIISTYENGNSWTTVAGDVSCDYSGKNAAKLIGNIHGHIHNLLTAPIFMDTGGGTQTGIYRISTPEACIGRENQYDSPWKEDTSYPKTQGTAEDTAFCIYCIDLDEHIIKAICYGAGYDREISY